MTYHPSPELERRILGLGERAKILDVGGWFAPYHLATHVVDIMPYETRGRGSLAHHRSQERFTRDTWVQADVTDPTFQLRYPDKFFDFALCMHTLEDLHEVRPLLAELSRTARCGYIECPSRLTEQTVGVIDRSSDRIGFNHHKWIVENEGAALVMYDKAESFYQPTRSFSIPLTIYERSSEDDRAIRFYWNGHVAFRMHQDWATCSRKAREFRAAKRVRHLTEALDRFKRASRRVRNRARGISPYPDPVDGGDRSSIAGAYIAS
jgi:hypothetical protein